MPCVPLVATRLHHYDGKVLAPGELFQARSRDDATVLKVIGAAMDPPVDEIQAPVRRRRYFRRDMQAED